MSRFRQVIVCSGLEPFNDLITPIIARQENDIDSAVGPCFPDLPTEFDASFNRALPLLEKENVLKKADKRHARRLLKAAAFTYVSASLMSLLNIARWFAILRR